VSLAFAGRVPAGWRLIETRADGNAYRLASGGHMTLIESIAREADGRRWHHVSIARPDRDPTWAEALAAKEALIGDREAYLVAPPRSRYVNLHPHALHWFSCLDAAPDGAVLPDFTRGSGSL
jgi:hypothetical protein